MSYLSLAHRVPEASAVEPKALVHLYTVITRAPLVRTVYRRFVSGALAQGVDEGWCLDLGTGPGTVAIHLARRSPGLHMVGLDLSLAMVQQARRKADRAGLNGRGGWPQADAHKLPFADGQFDLVFSSFAMHHWGDPLQILNEAARVLKPGGRYHLTDLCRQTNLVQRAFAYASIPVISLPYGSYRGYGGYYESVRSAYTRDEARDLLERSNLPPGEVTLDSTWFIPILAIASRGEG